ncbi:HEXXH motif-containing putative peptide modification protein [Streptomyces sp. NPDC058690]|uniref:aKG-HExxH-type peptide beta-hydroxylase n=1 Tax=Streptomyces sp. NPDC058690 TaxID=3346600 RepID=UPI003647BB58
MKAIPADLAEQVCSVGIDTGATGRLAATYHRSLARRAVNKLDEARRPQMDDLVRHTRRLAPATVYALYKGAPASDPAEITRQLQTAAEVAPTAVYDGPQDSLWLCDGLQEVLRSLNWGEERVGTVITDLPDKVSAALELARQALRVAWPQAWAEHNTLVHYLVFAQGPLRSATIQSTFGVVYAEVEEASDPLRMYELLLHESAHHALSLREQFTRFLDNPDTVGAHALRPDPRPLRGVLHAAFVMCRMAEGISRYRQSHPSGGPLDGCALDERYRFAMDSLREALNVLDKSAQWTEDGRALRVSMQTYAERQGVRS